MSRKAEWLAYDCIDEFRHCVDDVDGSKREVVVRINSDISVYNDSSLSNGMTETDDEDDAKNAEEEGNDHGEDGAADADAENEAKVVSDYVSTRRWKTWKCKVLDIRGKEVPKSEGQGMEIVGLLVQYYQRPEDLRCFQNALCDQTILEMEENELFISNQVDLVEPKSIADVISVVYTSRNGNSRDAAEQEGGYLCTGFFDVYKPQFSKRGTG
ncbi:Hypothetical protein D9617_44g038990 [Elsinoe fawcettii]|nr:Hypothetical protein D9617_44g038990 [Elsinoe fawcettii]